MNGHENQGGPPQCARCNKPIYDGTIFKVGEQFYHNACLRCVVCQKPLNAFCFAKGDKFYCSGDFTRLFGAKCCACLGVIAPTEQAHFVNGYVYHPACFTCAVCRRNLNAGDFFYMRHDMKLVCKVDYDRSANKGMGTPASDSDSEDEFDCLQRHRTCINDNQLRMLTQSYQSERTPSRQTIERLSRKVGLRPRVVRTWFQNRRAKDKHSATGPTVKNKQDGHKDRGPPTNTCVNTTTTYQNETPAEVNQPDLSQPYQLYCPLDYLRPDSMPPNIDLSSTDIQNGEVVSSKLTDTVTNSQYSGQNFAQLTTNQEVSVDFWFQF